MSMIINKGTNTCPRFLWRLWRVHVWEETEVYYYPNAWGEAKITRECLNCGRVETHERAGGI